MKKRLFAFLVGINDYPQSGVSPLKGCVNDATSLADFLQANYTDLEPDILLRTNAEATRAQFIQDFRAQLGQANDGDVVFFHFSGHGSREISPPELWSINPDKRNETLVLYDSRDSEGADLADVELAVLLWEISQGKPNLDVVVSLDCCHAGSGSKSADDFKFINARQAEKEGNSRTLAGYLSLAGESESYFVKNYRENQDNIKIPFARHILLAACDKHQKAWEGLDNQGLYTGALLQALQSETKISYAKLYQEVRILIHRSADFQDAQLENHGGFNAYSTFLEGDNTVNAPSQKIYFQDNQWQIDLGAVHGLNPLIQPEEEILLKVFPPKSDLNAPSQNLGTAKVIQVKPQKSFLNLDITNPDPTQIYQGVFISLPFRPLQLFLKGDEAGKAGLNRLFQSAEFTFLAEVTDAQDADYEIEAKGDIYYIYQNNTQELIQGIQNRELGIGKYAQSMGVELGRVLDHLTRWHNFSHLQNPKPKLNPVDIDFNFYEIDKNGQEHLHQQEEIVLDSFLENEQWQPTKYRIEISNNTPQSLYFHMFFVNNRYGVIWGNTKEIAAGRVFPLMYKDDPTGIIGFHPKEDKGSEIDLKIKIIVSTEPLDTHLFELKSLQLGKVLKDRFLEAEGVSSETFVKVSEDWFSLEKRIKIVKRVAKVSANDTLMANGKIKILGHQNLKANLALQTLHTNTRDIGGAAILGQVQDEGLECINFALDSRSTGQESILELADIEGDVSESDPLKIQLDIPLKEDEQILPLTFDGDLILPVGWANKDSTGKTQIQIAQLPSQNDERSRSIGKSLKLLFYKVVVGKQGKENAKLTHIYLNDKGKVVQESKNLKEKIQKLSNEKSKVKILLFIHGIIGNNQSNFKSFSQILPELDYDLILAFDYENLNTPLEDTATNLKTHLREVGLDQHLDKNKLEIICLAHSMGGLIARRFIEKELGNQVISKLIMLGTPNGGSVFGGVPGYLEFATNALIISLNFLNPYIGSAMGLLWVLNKNKDLGITDTLLKTLSQMEDRSEFIEKLNNYNDPQIPYYLLAGDVSLSNTKGVFLKIQQKLNNLILKKPHDGVVGHKSMTQIGSKSDATIQVIDAHHMNYFAASDSLNQLKQIL